MPVFVFCIYTLCLHRFSLFIITEIMNSTKVQNPRHKMQVRIEALAMKCGVVHTMKHCYATALYTTEAQALSVTHARISLPHACNHERSIRKECGK